MLRASLTVDPDHGVGPVQRRTFGSFVEHLGRCVYTGIFEPGHPQADDGLRRDVLDLVREMGVSVVRYPGGNFVSGYQWEDGVGPVEQRPARLDTAWHSLETNALDIGPRAFSKRRVVEHLVIADDDVRAANTEDRPDRVTPKQAAVTQADSAVEVVLPAVSWNVIRLQRAPA